MKENNLPQFVEDLSNYLSVIKNLSKGYIDGLTVTVKQFLEFINIHKFKRKYNSINDMNVNDIRCINNSDVYNFIYFLAENNYKTNTRVLKSEHLRTLFNYLYNVKHNIFKHPFKELRTERKIEKKIPNYLSLFEAQKLINVYSNSTDFNGIRNNAMIHLFLNCGLRVSELVNLNISDLDLTENKFIIYGKGNKERMGYLNESTKNALLKYLDIRKEITVINSKNKDALFLNPDYDRLTRVRCRN